MNHNENDMTGEMVDGRNVRCPRCRYDQRGSIATWIEQCPLEGTCTECGLRFNWAEVIYPEKFEPPWCVEFVPQWWRVPMACFKTFVRSFNPWRFWTQLKMSQPLRPARLMTYIMLMLVIPLVSCYVLWQGGIAMHVRNKFQWQLPLWRGSAPPTIHQSYFAAAVEAILFPTRATSSGWLQMPDGTTFPYPSPKQLYLYLGNSGIIRAGVLNEAWLTPIVAAIGCGIALTIFLPISLILLPASRRKAKVRWGHVFRIFTYSLFAPVVMVIVMSVAVAVVLWDQSIGLADVVIRQTPLAFWVLFPIWWAVAIKRYLKMPHSAMIVFLMTCILMLMLAPLWENVLPRWITRMVLN